MAAEEQEECPGSCTGMDANMTSPSNEDTLSCVTTCRACTMCEQILQRAATLREQSCEECLARGNSYCNLDASCGRYSGARGESALTCRRPDEYITTTDAWGCRCAAHWLPDCQKPQKDSLADFSEAMYIAMGFAYACLLLRVFRYLFRKAATLKNLESTVVEVDRSCAAEVEGCPVPDLESNTDMAFCVRGVPVCGRRLSQTLSVDPDDCPSIAIGVPVDDMELNSEFTAPTTANQ